MKIFKIDTLILVDHILDSSDVNVVKFGNDASTNLSVFHPEINLFCGSENQLVEIVKDELQGLWTIFIYLDNLGYNRSVEGLVLHLFEERKQLFYFFLHFSTFIHHLIIAPAFKLTHLNITLP